RSIDHDVRKNLADLNPKPPVVGAALYGRLSRCLQVVETRKWPVRTPPELLQEHRPAHPLMSLRPEYVLVLGQPLREAEGSPPERKACLLLLDIECVVECAFEESAENRPT